MTDKYYASFRNNSNDFQPFHHKNERMLSSTYSYPVQHQYECFSNCVKPLYQNVQDCALQDDTLNCSNYSCSDYYQQHYCPANLNGFYQPDESFDNYQQSSTTMQGGNELKPSYANNFNVTPAQAASFAHQPHFYLKGKFKLTFCYY